MHENDTFLTARVPNDLLNRMDAKATELKMTRSELLRQIMRIAFGSPHEISKEAQIRAWMRAGMNP